VAEALHWLPNTAPASAAPTATPTVGTSKKTGSADGRPPRIVWADDNADMRDYVGRLLAERYDVQSFPDGAAALTAIQKEIPDLVLSDIMMPASTASDSCAPCGPIRAHGPCR